MKNIFLGLVIAAFAGQLKADPIPLAKAAELALHRIEKLVILEKIAPSYQSKFFKLSIESLVQQKAEDPAFRNLEEQYPGDDATLPPSTLEIIQNADGKALSNKAADSKESTVAPTWPDKDPVTLCENGLHWIEETDFKKNPEIEPFFNDLKDFRIVQIADADHEKKVLALVTYSANKTKDLLHITLNEGGEIVKTEVEKAKEE